MITVRISDGHCSESDNGSQFRSCSILRHVLPIAHAGHWLVYVIYAVPVIIVLGSILLSVVRDRRAPRADDPPGA